MWLDKAQWLERQTGDWEVQGFVLTNCAVEHGPGKPLMHICFCRNLEWKDNDAQKLIGR